MAVSVSKYVLPKIKLAVEFDKPYYQPADSASYTVRAGYFFGKPVADAEVRVEVRRDGTALPADTIPVFRTDAAGEGVRLMKMADLIRGRNPDATETKLAFRVTVTDSAGQKQTSEVERLVTSRPLRIEMLPEGGTLVRGVPNKIYLLTTTADGKPASAFLHISGDVVRDLRSNDLGLASFTFTPAKARIEWTIQALGERDQILAERTDKLDSGTSSDDFLLRLDRAVYRSGDTMKLSALGGGSNPVVVDFYMHDGVRRLILSTTTGLEPPPRADSFIVSPLR